MSTFSYPALFAKQGKDKTVFVFCAPAKEVLKFASIDRINRSSTGKLSGFQRPQVANHIREIREYLNQSDAVLPNSVVVAFMSGVKINNSENGNDSITIDSEKCPGFVVDGQQRLSALIDGNNQSFDVFVTGLICESEEELRKQFILINNTKPLPKALIYELLPSVDGLPDRLSSRSLAAKLVERLNYDDRSSLKGQIKQQTNPSGLLQDTLIQKIIMSSLSDGALRERMKNDDLDVPFLLMSDYFEAVQVVFGYAWKGQKPRTSRLVHGAGIVAMGYVMEHLCAFEGAKTKDDFIPWLEELTDSCAWTEGSWAFSEESRRPWNSIQNIPRDYMELSQFLIRQLRFAQRRKRLEQPEETLA